MQSLAVGVRAMRGTITAVVVCCLCLMHGVWATVKVVEIREDGTGHVINRPVVKKRTRSAVPLMLTVEEEDALMLGSDLDLVPLVPTCDPLAKPLRCQDGSVPFGGVRLEKDEFHPSDSQPLVVLDPRDHTCGVMLLPDCSVRIASFLHTVCRYHGPRAFG